MKRVISKLLDVVSDYLASRKGLLPLLGILFVILNLVLQIVPGNYLIKETDFFLHLGFIVSVLGIMLAWAL